MQVFRLHEVWWLVSPGNPLKEHGPADMARRLSACREMTEGQRIIPTDIEAALGTRYTAATLKALRPHYPGVRFTWLMGADNLAQFHLWADWKWIMKTVPVGVLSRPGHMTLALTSPAARRFRPFRLRGPEMRKLGRASAPAWALAMGPASGASSTQIRNNGDWN